jgi:glycosyltransferase involved in cell wall biosynthesis
MQTDLPLVSILMTAYNREKYIVEAIESVIAQTYSNWELIIVDDSSSDKTVAIANEFVNKDSRITITQNPQNLGDYPNRNRAANFANGKYIMYLDSDDSFLPNAIEYVISVFSVFKDSQFATLYQYNDIDRPIEYSSEKIIQTHFFKRSILHIGPGGTVITNDLFNKIGGFTTLYGPASDMYYNIKVASNSKVILMPFKYLNYRIHEGQEINNHFSYLYNGYLYFQDIMSLPELPLSNEEKTFLCLKNKRRFVVNTIKYLYQHRDISKVIKAYKLANFSMVDFVEGVFH